MRETIFRIKKKPSGLIELFGIVTVPIVMILLIINTLLFFFTGCDALPGQISMASGCPVELSKFVSVAEEQYDNITFKEFEIEGVSDKFKQQMVTGIILTYQNSPDLSIPFAIFDSMIVARPDRPEGFFFKALLYSSIYSVDAQQTVFDSLEYYFDTVYDITGKLLKTDPDNKYYLFYLGAGYGNMGLYYLRKNSYWKAYRYGKKGKNYLKKAIEVDPEFGDARLGIGVFQYYTAVLSKYIKPLLYIIGMSGDKEKGLENIRLAVNKSYLSQVEARDFLSRIYSRYEGRKDDASEIYRVLTDKFPGNPMYSYYYAGHMFDYGDYKSAKPLLDALLARKDLNYPVFAQNCNYYSGLIYYYLGDYTVSGRYFMTLTNYPGKLSDNMRQTAFYATGLGLERTGKRTKAVNYYNRAVEVKTGPYDKDEIKDRIKNEMKSEEIQLAGIERFLNNAEYVEAESKIHEQIASIGDRTDKTAKLYRELFNVRLADVYFNLDRPGDALYVINEIKEKTIDEDKVELANYFLLSALIHFKLGNMKAAEDFIKKLSDIDTDDIKTHQLRNFLYLQQQMFNKIKYR